MTRRIDRTTQKVGDRYHVWHTEKIWQAAQNLPVIEVEIDSLKHVDAVCWFEDDFPATIRNVVEHFVRMEQVDPAFPSFLIRMANCLTARIAWRKQ